MMNLSCIVGLNYKTVNSAQCSFLLQPVAMKDTASKQTTTEQQQHYGLAHKNIEEVQ